ncbi:hypothetical protein AB0H76_00420 [Nocardia sp. NPDC050712]|uniref:hypothetical protein n=1 Tax=Nocardia sp. NPDC050712 TaxID=3155518 RepID=UPI0033D75E57
MSTPQDPQQPIDLWKSQQPQDGAPPQADPTQVWQPGQADPTQVWQPEQPAPGAYTPPVSQPVPPPAYPGFAPPPAPPAYPAYGQPYQQPGYPQQGYQQPYPGYGAPGYPPPYAQPTQAPAWSIASFACLAVSAASVLFFCGLPMIASGPAGVILGVVGHSKGEPLGKWAAIANGVSVALALILILLGIAAFSSLDSA